MADEVVQLALLELVGVVADDGLLRQHNVLCTRWVARQQAPVHVAAIAQIRVVAVLCGLCQHRLHHVLALTGPTQEQLHRRGEELQLYHRRFVVKRLEERLQQLVGVLDAVGVLADDPHHARLRLRLVQRVQGVAQNADDGLVPVGVLAEDVLDDHHRLLHHVVDLGLDELQQHLDAPLRGTLQLDGTAADSAHTLAHEVHVHFRRVLLQLLQQLVDVALRCQAHQDLQLLHLHVDGVVVLAEEHLDLVHQQVGALLHNQVDVAQGHILDLALWALGQRHQRRGQLPAEAADCLLVGDDLQVAHHDLHRRQHHRRVGVLQTRQHTLDNVLRLGGVAGREFGQEIQDEHLAPLRALVEGGEQLLQHCGGELQHVAVGKDFGQRSHGIGDHHRVGVANQLAELVQEALVAHHAGRNVKQLRHAHGGRFLHIAGHTNTAG